MDIITIITAILSSSVISTLLSYFLINRQSHKNTKEIKELESRLQLEAKKNEQLISIEAENLKNQIKQANEDLTKRKDLYNSLLENGYRVKKAIDNLSAENNEENLESVNHWIGEFRGVLIPARNFLMPEGKFDLVHEFIRQAEFLLRLIKDKQSKKQIKAKYGQVEALLSELYSIMPVRSQNSALQYINKSGADLFQLD